MQKQKVKEKGLNFADYFLSLFVCASLSKMEKQKVKEKEKGLSFADYFPSLFVCASLSKNAETESKRERP
jgi:hypothetical protein